MRATPVCTALPVALDGIRATQWARGTTLEGRRGPSHLELPELFLEARFSTASWPIVMSQPKHALAPARAVTRLVVPS
jgi:hypothetical protein